MDSQTSAKKILKEIQFATIATANNAGEPWNTPVFCAADNYTIYWSSHPDSVHSKNIAANGKVFIVIYNSKAGQGEGVGLYIRAAASIVEEPAAIIHALDILGKRRGKPFLHPEKFTATGPQRIYKASPLQLWTNDARQDTDGDFIEDFRVAVTVKDETLRMELVRRYAAQREMTEKAQNNSLLWDYELGKADTAYLKEVVANHGWPTVSLVGQDGAQTAWQLLQHADDDLAFQARCLELMKALPASEVRPRNIAYLEDRVRKGYGEPQLYGTQFIYSEGGLTAPSIEDMTNLDARRQAMGLGPYEEELQQNGVVK